MLEIVSCVNCGKPFAAAVLPDTSAEWKRNLRKYQKLGCVVTHSEDHNIKLNCNCADPTMKEIKDIPTLSMSSGMVDAISNIGDADASIIIVVKDGKISLTCQNNKTRTQFYAPPEIVEEHKKVFLSAGWFVNELVQMIIKKMGEIKDAKVCDRSIPGESVPDKDPDKS